MEKYGAISVSAFFLSFIVFLSWFFGDVLFTMTVLKIAIVLSVIGVVTAFLSKNKPLKIIGLLGNLLVFICAVMLPLASLLFWNQP